MGRHAENQGYAACYTTESLTDTLSIDLAILLPVRPVPVYSAAVGLRMAEAGATVSDGLMVWLAPHANFAALVAARESARASLAYWVGLPSYNDALARAGLLSPS